MYSVWFCDLEKAVKALKEAVPNLSTFCSIEGNVYGDFVIKNETETWIVRHTDYSVWHLEKGGHKWGNWIEVE